jgi:hypothetical protein
VPPTPYRRATRLVFSSRGEALHGRRLALKPALAPVVAEKLAKIYGPVAFDFDGEQATTAAMATRILHENDLTSWSVFTATSAQQEEPSQGRPQHAQMAHAALRFPASLRGWGESFLHDVHRLRRSSTGQAPTLKSIIEKLAGPG